MNKCKTVTKLGSFVIFFKLQVSHTPIKEPGIRSASHASTFRNTLAICWSSNEFLALKLVQMWLCKRHFIFVWYFYCNKRSQRKSSIQFKFVQIISQFCSVHFCFLLRAHLILQASKNVSSCWQIEWTLLSGICL